MEKQRQTVGDMKEVLSSVKTLDELRSEIKTPEEAVCAGMLIGEECDKMRREGNPDFASISVINATLDLATNNHKLAIDILRDSKEDDALACIGKVMNGRNLTEAMDDLLTFGLVIISLHVISSGKYKDDNPSKSLANLFMLSNSDDKYGLISANKEMKMELIKLGIAIGEDEGNETFTPLLMSAFAKAMSIDKGRTNKKLKEISGNILSTDELIECAVSDSAKETVASLIIIGTVLYNSVHNE